LLWNYEIGHFIRLAKLVCSPMATKVKARAAVHTLLGKGIYPIPEAAKLGRVSQRRIRYWMRGAASEEARVTGNLWIGQHEPIGDKLVIGFLDLQEIRLIDAFLREGVSWKTLRRAHDLAKEKYGTQHPFCTKRFATDGTQIIELARKDGRIQWEETAFRQTIFPSVVAPFLRDLEFSKTNELIRWWPMGTKRRVALDPAVQFGQPVIFKFGVRTEPLYLAAKAGSAREEIANWYEVNVEDVNDAIDFETQLAA
jgi:uncharacterized protein (DUF433 family)/DNA-binding transcriptional MerR regulator